MTKHRTPYIRCIALAVIIDDNSLFVAEGKDPITKEYYYRPLGGGIEYGELGHDALAREMQEELGQELNEIEYLTTIENHFTYRGEKGHEMVRCYTAEFKNRKIYRQTQVMGKEDNGRSFKALWVPIKEFENNKKRLVPNELLFAIQCLTIED